MSSDRTVLVIVPLVALLLLFYFMVLGPKRQEASKLDEDVTALEQQISAQEQTAQYAEEARQDFPKYYGQLVVLGKSVPEEADSASLLVQVNSIAQDSNITFDGLELAQSTSGDPATTAAAAPAPAAAPTAEASEAAAGEESASGTTDPTATPTTAVPATEAAAANLPIGATVGSAGLPTLPYTLTFTGGYFDVADFLAGVDNLVDLKSDKESLTAVGPGVASNGRLITVDGFVLKSPTSGPSPTLLTTLAVTTFITPPEQGLTGGATPGGPAPVAPAATPTAAPASTGVAP